MACNPLGQPFTVHELILPDPPGIRLRRGTPRGRRALSRQRRLQHIAASPGKIGDIARAAPVLTHFEHGYINEIAEIA